MEEVKTRPQLPGFGNQVPLSLNGLSDHVEAYLCLLVLNIFITVALSLNYLRMVPAGTSGVGWAGMSLALVSNAIFLNVLVSAGLAPLCFALRSRFFTLFILPLTFGWLNFCVYSDSILYRLFQFHLNGIVFKLLMMPKAGENFQVGMKTWLSAAMVCLLIYALEYLFVFAGFRLLKSRGLAPRLRKRSVTVSLALLLVLIPAADKLIYAWADIVDHYELLRVRNLFPLYQPLTMKRFARKYLGVEVAPRESLRVEMGANSLNYPKSALRLSENPRKPNILIIAVEGARFDMLTPEVMPFLYKWSESHIRGERHYSSGNQSIHAVFGMMYGLNGVYWNRVLSERQGPVLINELKKLGYSFTVLSSTNLTFAEATKTSFIEVPEAIHDQWPKGMLADARDLELNAQFKGFLDHTTSPFFAFIWYDASHQPYRFPPEHNVFETKLNPEDLNYVELARGRGQGREFFNRFKNSLHYVDSEIKEVMDYMGQKNLLDNTIVIIIGDHGEEFGECGQWGHGGGFSIYQTRVMMAASIPGAGPQKITRLTSHIDFVPTILEFIGVTNPRSDYSQGLPLTAEAPDRKFVIIGGWQDAAIIDDNSIIQFGLEAYNGNLSVMDFNCRQFPDRKKALAERQPSLVKVLNSLREFNK